MQEIQGSITHDVFFVVWFVFVSAKGHPLNDGCVFVRRFYNNNEMRSNIQCVMQCASIILHSIVIGANQYFPQVISP